MRSCLLMMSAAHPVHCRVHMMLTILYIRIHSITATILSCTRVITLLRPLIKYAIFCQNMQKASTAMPARRATTRSTLLLFSQNMHCSLSSSCNKGCQNAFVWLVSYKQTPCKIYDFCYTDCVRPFWCICAIR